MRNGRMTLAAALVVGATTFVSAGCGGKSEPEPAPRSRIPERPPPVPVRQRDAEKPMPPMPDYSGGDGLPAPPFDDVPLVSQRPPEQRAFVESYDAVGRPRILIFINRTLEGGLTGREMPPANGARDTRRYDDRDRDPYLRPGQYDEVDARQIDYEGMENVLTDWIASEGRVEVISPVMARQRLTDEQVRELQEGRPQMAGEVARLLDADVLVQVQARPTRQTRMGLEVRVVAEAINVSRGGQSIARAMVEIPPPLDKPQLNKYTRFLARKLMDGMTGSWRVAAADERANPRRDQPGGPQPGATQPGPGPGVAPPREPTRRPDPSDLRDTGPAPQTDR